VLLLVGVHFGLNGPTELVCREIVAFEAAALNVLTNWGVAVIAVDAGAATTFVGCFDALSFSSKIMTSSVLSVSTLLKVTFLLFILLKKFIMFGVLAVGVVAEAVALAVVVEVALVMVGVDKPGSWAPFTRDFFDLDLEGLIEDGDDAVKVPSWFVTEKNK
jgi:hypothetical protein